MSEPVGILQWSKRGINGRIETLLRSEDGMSERVSMPVAPLRRYFA
jgi:hypothetical protein